MSKRFRTVWRLLWLARPPGTGRVHCLIATAIVLAIPAVDRLCVAAANAAWGREGDGLDRSSDAATVAGSVAVYR